MFIYYDHMTECWTKEHDDGQEEIIIDMTPEDHLDEFEQEFDTEDEFWDWYNGK